MGNRLALSATRPGGEVSDTYYQYNSVNQLIGLTTNKGDIQSFSYDPRGNLTSILGWDEDGEEKVLASYAYDIADRLVSFSDWRGQQASFTYDPEGNRLSRVQSVLLRGPGRGNAYGHEHAPGQQDDFVPPGQEGGSTPPGQNEDFTPPGQAWKPAGFSQEESNYTLLLLGAYDDWSVGWSPLDLIYAGNGGGNSGGNGAQGNGAPGSDNGNGGSNGNGGGNGQGGDNGNSGGGNGHGNEGNNGNGNGRGNGQDNGQVNGKANGQDNGKGNGKGSEKGGNSGKALAFQNRYKAPPAPEYLTETLYFVNDLADPLAHVAAAYDDSGSYTMMNVWDPMSGSLLRSGSAEETQWALTDAQGSITGLMSNPASTGRMDWHATYDEFGQPMSRRKFDPSFPQGTSYFGFTGEPYDFVTGLTYLRNRYYAPKLGRFTSLDPLGTILGDPTTLSGYGYVMNNPLKWVDPWGLGPQDSSSGSAYADSAGGEFLAGAIAGTVVTKGIATVGAKVLGGIVAAHPVAAAVVGTAMIVGGTIASYQQRKEEQVEAGTWGKWSGVKTTLAAIGDVFGVSQVIEGITGKRLLTGEELSPGTAGWQLGSGIGMLSSWGAAMKKVFVSEPVQTAQGSEVYRVWGDDSGPWGRSWTEVNPALVEDFRSQAGLPSQNAGRFVSEGVLVDTSGVRYRAAPPIAHGQSGGLPELVIPDPESQIRLTRVSGANPPF